ncbi:MAG: LapA family protein [Candidatus Pacebacteria bacterium]|nr:LapA family protein [Candidatus Paceibacterota bacterium]
MILFLLLGVFLGIISVIFVAQNTDVVTVSFLTWQLEGSLALILFLAIISGALIILLVLLPSFIKDVFSISSLRRQKRKLEEELAETKHTVQDTAAEPTQVPPTTTL